MEEKKCNIKKELYRYSCNLSYLGLFPINKRLSEYLVKKNENGTLIRMKFKQEQADEALGISLESERHISILGANLSVTTHPGNFSRIDCLLKVS